MNGVLKSTQDGPKLRIWENNEVFVAVFATSLIVFFDVFRILGDPRYHP